MRRYHSKKAIRDSFVKLLNEKPIDKITVRDIVEDCELTRNTFYYYYDDIYDILDELLQANVEEFIKMDFSAEDEPEEIMYAAVALLPDDPKFLRHLCVPSKMDDVKLYFDKAADRFLDYYVGLISGEAEINERDKKLIFGFYKNASLGVFYDWLADGMKLPLQKEFKRIVVLFGDTIGDVLKKSVENPEKE